jgi:pre-rRNA-processing protein TSR2
MMNTQSTSAASPTTASVAFPMAEFKAGVTACLRSWSALRTAVDSGWGGNDSVAKADDLRDNIYRVMNGQTARPTIELEDLEDNLAIYMEEEFSVVLEDSSEQQVAQTLFRLYEECVQGKIALAEQLVTTALNYDRQIAAYPVQIQSTEHDDDEDDDDDDDDDDEAMMDTDTTKAEQETAAHDVAVASQQESPAAVVVTTSAAEYAAQSLFGKPKKPKAPRQPKEEPVEPQMDDDGFTSVTTKRRKPRN